LRVAFPEVDALSKSSELSQRPLEQNSHRKPDCDVAGPMGEQHDSSEQQSTTQGPYGETLAAGQTACGRCDGADMNGVT
jgi:hypothetical protein